MIHLPSVDDTPAVFIDHETELLPTATAEEIAAGNRLGATIDIDDDNDNGLEP